MLGRLANVTANAAAVCCAIGNADPIFIYGQRPIAAGEAVRTSLLVSRFRLQQYSSFFAKEGGFLASWIILAAILPFPLNQESYMHRPPHVL